MVAPKSSQNWTPGMLSESNCFTLQNKTHHGSELRSKERLTSGLNQVRTEDGQVYRRNLRHLFQRQDPITVDPPKSVSTDALPLDTNTPSQEPSPTEQEQPSTSDPHSADPPEEPCRATRSRPNHQTSGLFAGLQNLETEHSICFRLYLHIIIFTLFCYHKTKQKRPQRSLLSSK